MSKKIVTFGEIMLRLTTPDNLRIEQSRDFLVNYGGSEANVAISIANFGGEVEYITRIPDNALGDTCLAELRSHNIKTDHVLVGGHRLGTYYMEKAAAMRNSKVIYDREGSAFSELKPGMIDWKDAFKDAAIFHWSGIDAALTPGLADVCKEAIRTALMTAQDGATVLLAGKGHETYQIIGKEKRHFDEKEIVGEIFSEMKENGL